MYTVDCLLLHALSVLTHQMQFQETRRPTIWCGTGARRWQDIGFPLEDDPLTVKKKTPSYRGSSSLWPGLILIQTLELTKDTIRSVWIPGQDTFFLLRPSDSGSIFYLLYELCAAVTSSNFSTRNLSVFQYKRKIMADRLLVVQEVVRDWSLVSGGRISSLSFLYCNRQTRPVRPGERLTVLSLAFAFSRSVTRCQ